MRQPWAGCIAYLGKDTENRTWRCPDRHIGAQIAIHASASRTSDAVISVPLGADWPSLFAYGDDKPCAKWLAWKAAHPEAFPAARKTAPKGDR